MDVCPNCNAAVEPNASACPRWSLYYTVTDGTIDRAIAHDAKPYRSC